MFPAEAARPHIPGFAKCQHEPPPVPPIRAFPPTIHEAPLRPSHERQRCAPESPPSCHNETQTQSSARSVRFLRAISRTSTCSSVSHGISQSPRKAQSAAIVAPDHQHALSVSNNPNRGPQTPEHRHAPVTTHCHPRNQPEQIPLNPICQPWSRSHKPSVCHVLQFSGGKPALPGGIPPKPPLSPRQVSTLSAILALPCGPRVPCG